MLRHQFLVQPVEHDLGSLFVVHLPEAQSLDLDDRVAAEGRIVHHEDAQVAAVDLGLEPHIFDSILDGPLRLKCAEVPLGTLDICGADALENASVFSYARVDILEVEVAPHVLNQLNEGRSEAVDPLAKGHKEIRLPIKCPHLVVLAGDGCRVDGGSFVVLERLHLGPDRPPDVCHREIGLDFLGVLQACAVDHRLDIGVFPAVDDLFRSVFRVVVGGCTLGSHLSPFL